MKLTKRLIFGLLALSLSGAALAQTTIAPNITGISELNRMMIDHIGFLRLTRNTALVATPAGTLANSQVLTYGSNIIATVASTNDAVTLPTLTGSILVLVVNNGANTMRIFPNVSTGQIDTAGAGTAKTLAANKAIMLWQGSEGLWYSFTSP